jgi:hypothetical protein
MPADACHCGTYAKASQCRHASAIPEPRPVNHEAAQRIERLRRAADRLARAERAQHKRIELTRARNGFAAALAAAAALLEGRA